MTSGHLSILMRSCGTIAASDASFRVVTEGHSSLMARSRRPVQLLNLMRSCTIRNSRANARIEFLESEGMVVLSRPAHSGSGWAQCKIFLSHSDIRDTSTCHIFSDHFQHSAHLVFAGEVSPPPSVRRHCECKG